MLRECNCELLLIQATKGVARSDMVLLAQTTSTSALLFSSTVRSQYSFRHPSRSTPTVRFVDLAFSCHALVLSIVTLSQFMPRVWGWRDGELRTHSRARPTRAVRWLLLAAGFSIAGSITAVLVYNNTDRDDSRWQWLDVVRVIVIVPFLATKRYRPKLTSSNLYYLQMTTFSMIKVLLTILKYVPQALSHIYSRSTLGFSITQVLFDTAGGIFSIVQLLLDSYGSGGGWEGVATSLADNPGKLGLAGVSLVFDMVFIIQHYVLYRPISLSQQEDRIKSNFRGEQRALLE